MFKIIKNLCKGFCVFVGSFLIIHMIASSFYEVGPDGYLQAPNSYPLVLLLISGALTFLSFNSPRNLLKRLREKERLEAMSDVEKWQLDRNALQSTPIEAANPSVSTIMELPPIADQAAAVFFETGQASVSMLQRKLKLNYSAAADIVDQLEAAGVVSSFSSGSHRTLLMSQAAYESRKKGVPAPTQAPIYFPEKTSEFFEYGGVDADLLSIDLMEGHDFEYWCANLLRKLGFADVEVTPGSGDQGVDVLAKKDGIKYAVQCKCYGSDLGNKPVQEVHAGQAIYHCQVGAVMTNRHFTAGGRQLAEATGVLLWDRDWITDKLRRLEGSNITGGVSRERRI